MTKETLTLRVHLEHTAASRTLQLEARASLHDLAFVICRSFDFDFDHAFGFYGEVKSRHYTKSKRKFEVFADAGEGSDGALSVSEHTALGAFPKVGAKMLYLFDYGDEWRFIVTRVADAELKPGTKLPRIVAARGKAPEQYPSFDE